MYLISEPTPVGTNANDPDFFPGCIAILIPDIGCIEGPGFGPDAISTTGLAGVLRIRVLSSEPSIMIDSVLCALAPDSSFTTAPAERTMRLHASTGTPANGDSVMWRVVDDSTNQVSVGQVTAPATGASTQFTVTGPETAPQRPDTMRWVAFSHPGTLAQKALSYVVTAAVTQPDGTPVVSPPVRLRQIAKDVLRQEYLDFGIGGLMPARVEMKTAPDITLRHFSFAEVTTAADYAVAIYAIALASPCR